MGHTLIDYISISCDKLGMSVEKKKSKDRVHN